MSPVGVHDVGVVLCGKPRREVHRRVRGMRATVSAAIVVAIALAGCTVGRTAPPSTGRATGTPALSTCSTVTVVRGWPVTRLAAEVVAVPVLDFNLSAVTGEVRDGAGGVLFLGSVTAPTDLGARVRRALRDAPARTRPLVMADEEGGGVQRLAPLVPSLPWPRDMARTMTPAQVRALAARTGRRMRAAGVTVDLAPVADVDGRAGPSATNPDGARSFSAEPATAAAYTVAFLRGLLDGGVLPVVKHFPGLGGTTANTDLGPAATVPLSRLRSTGLVPFRAAVTAGAPAVMVSNAAVPGLTTTPSSLAPSVVDGLLRRQLRFHGLVVTDSLSAGAILSGGRTLPQAAVAAIGAGADLVLFGSTLTAHDVAQLRATNVRRSFDGIVRALTVAVDSGRLSRARLVRAAVAVADATGTDLCR